MWALRVNGRLTEKRFTDVYEAFRLYRAYERLLDARAEEKIELRIVRLGE